MENNRRGSGIFLGVVAVATLVVAIIGATFAYFSISAQSNEDAVNVTAYEFNATLSVNNLYPDTNHSGLIPLDPEATVANVNGANNKNLLYAINEATDKCIDSFGYQVCQVVELTFTNGGSSDMVLTGTLKTIANNATSSGRTGATAFTSLKMRVASGTLGTSGAANTLTFDQTTGQTPQTIVIDVPTTADTTESLGNVTIPGGQTVKKYYVVYLDGTNDSGENAVDQSAQMGASYQGQFIFGDSVSGNRLTGTFNVGGASAASSAA